MNDKVKYAHMHQKGFVPGLNRQVEKGLDSKTYPGLEMRTAVEGVECWFDKHHFIIPYVNFQSIVLEDNVETVKESSPKKK